MHWLRRSCVSIVPLWQASRLECSSGLLAIVAGSPCSGSTHPRPRCPRARSRRTFWRTSPTVPRRQCSTGGFVLSHRSLARLLPIWPCKRAHRLGPLGGPWDFLRVVGGSRHAKSLPTLIRDLHREVLGEAFSLLEKWTVKGHKAPWLWWGGGG